MAGRLKSRFYLTYIWPHLILMASLFVLFSTTGRERVAGHCRRCMRVVHSFFQCPTSELHRQSKIATLDERLRGLARNRLRSIQLFEPAFVDHDLQAKNLFNILHKHYRERRSLQMMPNGRPNQRLIKLLDNERPTLLDFMIASMADGPWSQRNPTSSSTIAAAPTRPPLALLFVLPLSVCHPISFRNGQRFKANPSINKHGELQKQAVNELRVLFRCGSSVCKIVAFENCEE